MPTVSVPGFFRLYGLAALLPADALATTAIAATQDADEDRRPAEPFSCSHFPTLPCVVAVRPYGETCLRCRSRGSRLYMGHAFPGAAWKSRTTCSTRRRRRPWTAWAIRPFGGVESDFSIARKTKSIANAAIT